MTEAKRIDPKIPEPAAAAELEDFLCPLCGGPVRPDPGGALLCADHGPVLRLQDGLWRPTQGSSLDPHAPFLEGYRQVREAEGWGSDDPAYLRALPFEDLSGRHAAIWRIRAASFTLLRRRLAAFTTGLERPARVLDLGAGNGWLSLRLAAEGHRMTALDLSDDPRDGLAAATALPEAAAVRWLLSGFEAVPLAGGGFDVAIFNGSFHYSLDAAATLREARRLLRPGGLLVIVDSPVYRKESSGHRMLEERRQRWDREHAFETPEPASIGFLTRERLANWGRGLGFGWHVEPLPLGWRWRVKPYLLPLLGRREPARFPLIVGRLVSGS